MEKLICPACGRELTEINFNGLVTDICQNGCAGIWFDKKELDKVDEKHEREGLILLSVKKDPSVQVNHQEERFCPRCKDVKMRKHFWSVKAQVEIDECDKCKGIWLDDGELEKIRSLYENQAEKDADAAKHFRQLSYELFNKEDKVRKQNAPWYDKLASAIFGI